jgi:glycerol-3-phosphate dehydrogenase
MRRDYDLAIVGGGIHGAGIAQAAAARGQRVLVLEQTGIASGTSSRSSKLIHGGLRYLEQGDIGLVRECLRERAILLKIAPDLVTLKPFYIPVYPHTKRRPWLLRLGLAAYALLAWPRAGAGFSTLPRRDWDRLDGLRIEGLQTVLQYWDAQTDDALLTRAVMASAQSLGAELVMPARFTAAQHAGDGWELSYTHDGREHSVKARVLVNAAGPWANEVLAGIAPTPVALNMDTIQGTHIVVPGNGHRGCYYVEAPQDGRAVFVLPWYGKVMVGTTETPYSGDPAAVRPLPAEIDYLLTVLAQYFPNYARATPAVLESFAGLRVLPAAADRPFVRSRDMVLSVDRADKPRLLTLYGGKLTSYRADAEKVMKRLQASLPARPPIADTRNLPLVPEK